MIAPAFVRLVFKIWPKERETPRSTPASAPATSARPASARAAPPPIDVYPAPPGDPITAL